MVPSRTRGTLGHVDDADAGDRQPGHLRGEVLAEEQIPES
jgi:hypothetical protein